MPDAIGKALQILNLVFRLPEQILLCESLTGPVSRFMAAQVSKALRNITVEILKNMDKHHRHRPSAPQAYSLLENASIKKSSLRRR